MTREEVYWVSLFQMFQGQFQEKEKKRTRQNKAAITEDTEVMNSECSCEFKSFSNNF